MITDIFLQKVDNEIANDGKKLIVNFFISFSRFECALKTSIVFANGDENKVEANWDRFVVSISQDFNPDISKELKEAVEYIIENPPKIQAIANKQLIWRARVFHQNTSDINKLCLHIRDIRNNLFHGGKFNGNYEPDISRNYILINSAIIILNAWLALNDSVKKDFVSSFN
ncbi:hypothetical protein [Mucilaginibacter aquariorum]|uniref:RiboL-PSP-HEPN domain-containing protein n=1 Tax=Mucilaginibacter aquariorum TaxID=2967225 RepID=A0ABT1T776_9SPHI|nr:hypothetical protein [Mucilaginibacter aquariorum]MCQ6960424.1 hypothetical protein [Mucilaginibacter aquariorum]